MARTTMQLHTARSAQTFCAASACYEAHTAVLAMDALSASNFVCMEVQSSGSAMIVAKPHFVFGIT